MTNEEIIEFCEMKAELESENEDIYETIIKELEKQPSEDTEVIKVSKGAVKARQGRFIIYDVEWLKKNFYVTEEKIYGQPKESCEDCISRKAVINAVCAWGTKKERNSELMITMAEVKQSISDILADLPPVTPKYTDEEIDRAQAVEEAYIDKMVELAVEELKRPKGRWIMPQQDDGMSDPIYYQVRCSECGFDLDPQTWHMELHRYGADKYCPNCGAKMIEPQDKTKQGLAYADQDTLMSAT